MTVTSTVALFQTTSISIKANSTQLAMADFMYVTPIIMLQTFLVTAISDPSYPTCTIQASYNLY